MSSISVPPIKKNNTTKYVLIGVGALVAVIFVIVLIIILAAFLLTKRGGVKLDPPTITNITPDEDGNNYIITGTNFDENDTKYQWPDDSPIITPILTTISSNTITIFASTLNNSFLADGVREIKIITPGGSATYVVPKSAKVDANLAATNASLNEIAVASSGRKAIKVIFGRSITIPPGFYNAGKSGTEWYLRTINVKDRITALITIEQDGDKATPWVVTSPSAGGNIFTDLREGGGFNMAALNSGENGDVFRIPTLSLVNQWWSRFFYQAKADDPKPNEEIYRRQTFNINEAWGDGGGGGGLVSTQVGAILDLVERKFRYNGTWITNTNSSKIKSGDDVKCLAFVYKTTSSSNYRVARMDLVEHPNKGQQPLGPD